MTENIQQPARPYSWGKKNTINSNIADFASVYTQHRLPIYRYILARVGHVEDAHDLTAQVFLKAYQGAASYRQQTSIIYWLIGIARHQIVDYYRGQRADVPLGAIGELPHPAPSLEPSLAQKERLVRVSEALNALSEDRREALSLRLFAGLSNQEIARVMKKKPAAVAMLVHRGIQDLKLRLGGEDNA